MRSTMGSMAGMMAVLGAGLAGGAREMPRQLHSYGRESEAGREYRPARIGSSPKAARHWHDPKDPAQEEVMSKAAGKRRLREIDRSFNALRSYGRNPTVDPGDARRVPTYIAK